MYRVEPLPNEPLYKEILGSITDEFPGPSYRENYEKELRFNETSL